jgi:hypothetical protein
MSFFTVHNSRSFFKVVDAKTKSIVISWLFSERMIDPGAAKSEENDH